IHHSPAEKPRTTQNQKPHAPILPAQPPNTPAPDPVGPDHHHPGPRARDMVDLNAMILPSNTVG
ncbi:hypothetical protein ACFXHB_15725, partial [Kitasatospora sp. NPDC059327]